MNLRRLALLAFTLPLVAAACASPSGDEPSAASSQDMTDAWLDANIPRGSALEGKVLALVNDSTMNTGDFMNECGFSQTQASNVIAYRNGDTVAESDNQSFNSLQELDAVPFTDATFWANTVRCAILHTPGPSVCAPEDRAPVILELVVDESGSMSGDKWFATRDSILALFDKLHVTDTPNVLVGLMGFDDSPLQKIAPKRMSSDQFADLNAQIDKPNPHGGSTGTEKALSAAISIVDHVPGASQPGVRKIVVLVSDGVPNGGDAEKDRCVQITTAAHSEGVELYAVGIGDPSSNPGTYDPSFMGRLAIAGGTAPAFCDPDSLAGNVCHIQITPSAGSTQMKGDLTTALESIRKDAVPQACP